jgi:hypothetical protein
VGGDQAKRTTSANSDEARDPQPSTPLALPARDLEHAHAFSLHIAESDHVARARTTNPPYGAST